MIITESKLRQIVKEEYRKIVAEAKLKLNPNKLDPNKEKIIRFIEKRMFHGQYLPLVNASGLDSKVLLAKLKGENPDQYVKYINILSQTLDEKFPVLKDYLNKKFNMPATEMKPVKEAGKYGRAAPYLRTGEFGGADPHYSSDPPEDEEDEDGPKKSKKIHPPKDNKDDDEDINF